MLNTICCYRGYIKKKVKTYSLLKNLEVKYKKMQKQLKRCLTFDTYIEKERKVCNKY